MMPVRRAAGIACLNRPNRVAAQALRAIRDRWADASRKRAPK